MPINYNLYPANWKTEIRPRILARAENRCECCGLKNYSTVFSFKDNQKKTIWVASVWNLPTNVLAKYVKVILTIAHLDHDESNLEVKDDRLKALCQLCHLRYDVEEKKKRKLTNK